MKIHQCTNALLQENTQTWKMWKKTQVFHPPLYWTFMDVLPFIWHLFGSSTLLWNRASDLNTPSGNSYLWNSCHLSNIILSIFHYTTKMENNLTSIEIWVSFLCCCNCFYYWLLIICNRLQCWKWSLKIEKMACINDVLHILMRSSIMVTTNYVFYMTARSFRQRLG